MASAQKIDLIADKDSERLDVFLARHFLESSRTQIQKSIKLGLILVNTKASKASHLLCIHDRIVGSLERVPSPSSLEPHFVPFEILFEDDDLIVINKPPGINVHPGAGVPQVTIAHGLLYHCLENSYLSSQYQRPGIVHRLDRDTSGVLVCAKNEESHRHLSRQFAEKTNQREYLALLDGVPDKKNFDVESILIRDPVNRLKFKSILLEEFQGVSQETLSRSVVIPLRGRGGSSLAGRYAKSSFQRLEQYGDRFSLCKVGLHTGRTHQIRVHAASRGFGILGDPLYTQKRSLPKIFGPEVHGAYRDLTRQMLHAFRLGVTHPTTGKWMEWMSDPPHDFKNFLELLKKYKNEE